MKNMSQKLYLCVLEIITHQDHSARAVLRTKKDSEKICAPCFTELADLQSKSNTCDVVTLRCWKCHRSVTAGRRVHSQPYPKHGLEGEWNFLKSAKIC